MKKLFLSALVIAFMTLWHPVPAQAQVQDNLIATYCVDAAEFGYNGYDLSCSEHWDYVAAGQGLPYDINGRMAEH